MEDGTIQQKCLALDEWLAAYNNMEGISVADPGPGAGSRCLFEPWILDPGSGMAKNQDPDPGPGSVMNIPDHISVVLSTVFLHFHSLNSLMRIQIRDPESF
jgi:hypothetical protein